MNDVTQILSRIEEGNGKAAEELLPLVYDELRKLAAAKMAQEKPGQTLQATALVHEAYVRLVDTNEAQHWNSRGHFFAAAAEAMRRVLVENARKKARLKRGGDMQRQQVEDVAVESGLPIGDLVVLDEAIAKLEQSDPQAAQAVKLRFFAGLSHQEVGEVLGVSAVTAREHWRYARVWLHRELQQR
jgi:RNA polymerase sigma factor (TIGR02999 family)